MAPTASGVLTGTFSRRVTVDDNNVAENSADMIPVNIDAVKSTTLDKTEKSEAVTMKMILPAKALMISCGSCVSASIAAFNNNVPVGVPEGTFFEGYNISDPCLMSNITAIIISTEDSFVQKGVKIDFKKDM
ncbi:hypothetical protein ABNU38_03785 [Citrobacter braakii]|nr:hypothetical protein [Citrobacter braakii]MEB8065577.1 hypothetical protein [Citrobacter braakii]